MRTILLVGLLVLSGCSVKGSDSAPPISAVAISATSTTFSPTYPGRTRTSTLLVTNTGQLPVTVSLSVAPGAPFSVASSPAMPATLSPQAVLTLTVSFAPVVTGFFATSLVLATTASSNPALTVTLAGTGDIGTATTLTVGGFGPFSPPTFIPPDRAVFATTGPDLLPGTADDRIAVYHAGAGALTLVAMPSVAHGLTPGDGGKVLFGTGGPDAVIGTADDTLVLLRTDSPFTTEVATVGALTTSPMGRPLYYPLDVGVVPTGGPDLAFGTADDTLAIVKFSPLSIVHTTVGPFEPAGTSLTGRPATAADGSAAAGLPGADLTFGTADDAAVFITFFEGTGALDTLAIFATGPLHPTLSEFRVWRPGQGAQMRPGPDGVMGTPDDLYVEINQFGAVLGTLTLPNAASHVEILNQPLFLIGDGANCVLGEGADGVAGTSDDVLFYIRSNPAGAPALEVTVPWPGVGPGAYSRPLRDYHGPPIDFDFSTNLPKNLTVLGLGVGPDGLVGTLDDRLNHLDVADPFLGPFVTSSATVGPMPPASEPAFLTDTDFGVVSGLGPDGLPRTADDVLVIAEMEASPIWVGTRALPGLDSTLVSRAIGFGNTVLVLTSGPDLLMNTADDELVRVVFPLP